MAKPSKEREQDEEQQEADSEEKKPQHPRIKFDLDEGKNVPVRNEISLPKINSNFQTVHSALRPPTQARAVSSNVLHAAVSSKHVYSNTVCSASLTMMYVRHRLA